MALSPGEAPEIVIGRDERVQVDPMTSPPYNWICFLWIHRANGQSGYKGSGFKIHLPDINRTAIVTSGHCTYDRNEKEYYPRITVMFPGQTEGVEVVSNDLYAAPEYIKDGKPNHDYGLILLPYGSDNKGFGWSAIIHDDELKNRLVTNCGYPGDKPTRSMWITGRKIEKVENRRLFYMNDTYGGQSGSPVYTWYDGYWTVIGIHGYGGSPNSAPRITHQMISRFLDRIGGLKAKTLRSVKFPDVYLGCDNKRVLCQNKPATSSTKFYIYPIEMPPSLALETDIRKVVIESVKWRNTFIRMDARDMTKFEPSGGGEVKCHFLATSSWESYYVKEDLEEKTEKGKFSFRNVMFPHCYIRLDGPSGTINCQYYEDKRAWKPPPKPTAWELFYIEEHQ